MSRRLRDDSGACLDAPYSNAEHQKAILCARHWTSRAVRSGLLPKEMFEDVVQECLIACWQAYAKFQASRVKLSTYFDAVAAKRGTSAVRRAYRHRKLIWVDLPHDLSHEPDRMLVHQRIDVWRVIHALPREDQRVALLLMTVTPVDAARELGIARSTLYERIRRLRKHFASLRPIGRATDGPRSRGGKP